MFDTAMSDIPVNLQSLLMDQISDSVNGIAVLDRDDIILYFNRAFAHMFGFTDEITVGQTHKDFARWLFTNKITVTQIDDFAVWLEKLACMHRQQSYRRTEVELTDGRWLALTAQVYQDGSLVLVCADLTSHKQTELALISAHRELEQLALTDELTGLANRRSFLRQLQQEFQRHRRYQGATCLAMLDLDFFKSINDRYGHPAGDAVLHHFGQLLSTSLRSQDSCGRLGGEEFAIVFCETQPEQALFVINRMRERLQHSHCRFDGMDLSYSFSAGVAQLNIAIPHIESWIQLADRALYQAKQGGRNRTELANSFEAAA